MSAPRSGVSPDTVVLLAVMFLIGAALTVTGQTPGSVDRLVPEWLGIVWSAAFAIASGVSLVGALWRDPLTGWLLELSGRIALACTGGAYVLALVGSITQWGSTIIVGTVAALALSSIWRAWQVTRQFLTFRATVKGARDES